MDSNGIDYRAALYGDFPLDAHEIREGNKSKSGKIQWFVYIGREAIQDRLDDLFFMRWGLTYDKREMGDKFFSITACIAIDGVPREYNGEGHPRGPTGMTGDVMKAAYTDAFRRAASMWGIGLYLQKTPAIWTEGYTENNWNEQRQRQDEAMAIFKKWFLGDTTPQQKQAPQPKAATQKPTPTQQPENGHGEPPATNGKVTPMPAQATGDNAFQASSAYYQKTSQGGYIVFRADHDTELTATMFGGREKLTELMGKTWADANSVDKWANGTHKLVLPVYVKWAQDEKGNRKVEELKAS